MPTNPIDPQNQPWFQQPALRRILDVIASGGAEARVVGGAVRDALLGRAVGDIDLATNAKPDETSDLLTKAGIKVVPTGIDHGTVTAVIDHKAYEITTLRHDIATDGRRAKVAFTDDWQADAARRDFTFNALYVDAKGALYDYFDGQRDLAAGHVRFIGDASQRIQEDVLRILRFFRFTAWFGKGEPDAEALDACKKLAHLIPQLSAERVWREIIKLLAADNPVPAWKLMQDSGVLAHILPEATDLYRLAQLLIAENLYEAEPDSLTRLASLLPPDETVANTIARTMKLSRREAEKLVMLSVLPGRLKGKLDPVPFRRSMYMYGADYARAAVLLTWHHDGGVDLKPVLELASLWEKPVFPLQGEDILKLGIAPGPKVGTILRLVEDWWIARDFRPSREECLSELTQQSKD